MSTYIDSIKDKDGNTVLPISNPKAVYFDNGERLDNVIKDINADILMLGWEVPMECPIQNYVDENRVFHQRVGRVDLGSLEWFYRTGEYTYFYSKVDNSKNYIDKGYCNKYLFITSQGYPDDKTMNGAPISHYKQINVNDSSYTDVTTFKSAMQGVYLYYELAEEITKNVDGNEVINRLIESFNYPNGEYVGIFRYAGYDSGAFLQLPRYIIENYNITAETFGIPGLEGEVNVDRVQVENNGVVFLHHYSSYKIDLSGKVCNIYGVTFTPKE